MNTPRLPRLLVTGANGFVMSNCIPVWLSLGYEIVALDRTFDPMLTERWKPAGSIRFIDAVLDNHFSYKTLPAVDAIIHGAAVTVDAQTLGLSPEAHLNANLQPALSLLEWADENNVGRVICISSSAVYAATDGWVMEDQPPTPIGTYAVAKAAIEAMTATLKMEAKRDVLTVRLGNVYGIGEQPSTTRPRLSLIGRMLHDAVTSGTMALPSSDQPDPQSREWTFAPDIADAIHALLETRSLNHALYHIAAGARADRFDVAAAVDAILPGIQRIVEDSPSPFPLTRKGILTHTRLKLDTRFDAWTPLAIGVRRALESASVRQLVLS